MEALLEDAPPPRLTHDMLLSIFEEARTPRDLFRIGTEAEKIGVYTSDGSALPFSGPRGVARVLEELSLRFGWFPESEYEGGEVIALRRGEASITLEPGGQVELSGSPVGSVHDAAMEIEQHLDELNEVGRTLGITWLNLGFHPFATQQELPWVPKLRYGVMKEYLPTRGSMGLDMMRRTCTVQANLDYASEDDAVDTLRIGLALSPVVSAMFANSPLLEGRPSGERSRRVRVWLNTDPDRTGLLPFVFEDAMSFERYVQWALDVPMFLVKRGSRIVHNTGQTFRAFMRDGFEGTQATLADWQTHLGTLFPEVRLKSTIEMRSTDMVPRPMIPALPALWKGLLYEPTARARARTLASQLAPEACQEARAEVADRGLQAEIAGRPVQAWAEQVLEIARDGLVRIDCQDERGRSETVYLEPLHELLAAGLTPADRLLSQLDPDADVVRQVLKLAHL